MPIQHRTQQSVAPAEVVVHCGRVGHGRPGHRPQRGRLLAALGEKALRGGDQARRGVVQITHVEKCYSAQINASIIV